MEIRKNNADTYVESEIRKGSRPNRLLHEKSPYLLQHAFNPVQWFPWGEEAFAKAREDDKPIFLSIGYSTCHWCHVMARESFTDAAVAGILNRSFICIKVDREERPDVDQLYMAAVQAMTGSGGWPLSIFLTPELKPFYGGTYFPPKSAYGLPGFASLIMRISETWEKNRVVLSDNAEKTTAYLHEGVKRGSAAPLGSDMVGRAFAQLSREFDEKLGGFGKAPKFPRPASFNFLLRYYHRTRNEQALNMVLFTLRKMAAGGIYDHLGGGFHRYSVDSQWRTPHFEKMLYDQGQLALAYLEAFQLSGDRFYAAVAEDIISYVFRDLRDAEGAFLSAMDAESADRHQPEIHGEGLYYLWEEEEIRQILGEEKAAVFNFHYGVQGKGNALADPHHEFVGKNILYIAHSLETTAENFMIPVPEVTDLLNRSCQELLKVRALRPAPHLDDKVITAWNGHMISALTRAYQILDRKEYLRAAEKSATFILERLYDRERNILFRSYRAGHAGPEATLDDYASLVKALIDLYESTFDIDWLKQAVHLTEHQISLFEDHEQGGFFDAAARADILVRLKSDYDGAEPTGNSITAHNLLYLGAITGNRGWLNSAEKIFQFFSGRLAENPATLPQMLVAYDLLERSPLHLVIAGRKGADDTRKMVAAVYGMFIPDRILMLADNAEGQELLAGYLPHLSEVSMIDGRATAYICKDFSCQRPTTDPLVLPEMLHPN